MKERYLSDKEMEEMSSRGWSIRRYGKNEKFNTKEELYNYYIKNGYKVKFYYTTTYVRGYYRHIAMIKFDANKF